MKNLFTYLLLGFIATSCGLNKVPIENTQRIDLEYDKNKSLNYGDSIRVDFFAVQLSGERTNISNSYQLEVYGDGIRYERKNNHLYIVQKPLKKDNYELSFQTVLKRKSDSISFQQHLMLNFKGPLRINLSGENGEDGNNRMSRLRPALLSSGKDGKEGYDGSHGKDGLSIKVHIWKAENMFYARVKQLKSDTVYYYQSQSKNNMIILAAGGDGGNGGDGGSGSRGKDGKIYDDSARQPGNGGDGSNGGNGGNGGKGGSVEVIVHPNAAEVLPTLKIVNHGGAAGKAGEPGEPGKAGKPASGQKPAPDGEAGNPGEKGLFGENGPQPIIKTEDFNYIHW